MPESTLLRDELQDALVEFDLPLLRADRRVAALAQFRATPTGRERPGRYWKIDLDGLAPDPAQVRRVAGHVSIEGASGRVIACNLQQAAEAHAALIERAFNTTGASARKFGALSLAFAQLGAFVYVPADVSHDEPIVIRYALDAAAAAFPWTLVLLERGARASVIERFEGGSDAFVCATHEAILGESAHLDLACIQACDPSARFIATRAAMPGRNARIAWARADFGAQLASTETTVSVNEPGSDSQLTALFFPTNAQHVEAVDTVDHRVGASTSQTIVKSAAAGRGQARYLGNIRIAADAQGVESSLRDDALLLSRNAHIDSIPALEIAANDVRAYHGATVGAIDESEIFYMQSRGIEREAAERMIALGFFEPAIERFPGEALRDELRAVIAEKIA